MLQRLSDDWRRIWGYPLELAEAFVDPAQYEGTVYRASNWQFVGQTRGHSRVSGGYSESHGQLKDIYLYPLDRSSLARLSGSEPQPDWAVPSVDLDSSAVKLPSLTDELKRVPDHRRKQGRRHRLDTALGICVLARLAGKVGALAVSRYAQSLTQEQLEALGARRDREGKRVPPSLSTVYRVMTQADSDELHEAGCRWARAHPATPGVALAAHGKRINGANRTGDGYHETATLVEHTSGVVFACRTVNCEGGETAAVRRPVPRHRSRRRRRHRRRSPHLQGDGAEHRRAGARPFPVHRPEKRFGDVRDPRRDRLGRASHPHMGRRSREAGARSPRSPQDRVLLHPRQRLQHPAGEADLTHHARENEPENGAGDDGNRLWSHFAGRATAQPARLLELNRGHRTVENRNHRRRDTNYVEDDCMMRTGKGPDNCAALNNIALAVILTSGYSSAPAAIDHFQFARDDALEKIRTRHTRHA